MDHFDDVELVDGGFHGGYTGRHHWRWEAFLALQYCSAGRMYFSRADQDPNRVERPTLFWTLPEETYQFGPMDAQGWDHHWLALRGPRAERLVRHTLHGNHPGGLVLVERAAPMLHRFRELVALAHSHAVLARARAGVLLEEIALALAVEAVARQADDPQRRVLSALAEAITADPASPWDLAQEAGRLGWSMTHFRRRCSAVWGCAPHAFLIRARLRSAAAMLRQEPTLAVAEVGRRCGFSEAQRFSQAFRAGYGISPQAFRGSC